MVTFFLCTAVMMNVTPVLAAPIEDVEIYDPAGESDEVVFIAGEHQGSQSGEGNTNTETEIDQEIASQNASLFREQKRLMTSIIENSVEGSVSVYVPGQSILIREEIPVTVQDLLSYITNGLKFEKIEGLYGIYHSQPNAEITENTEKAIRSLKQSILGSDNPSGNLPFQIGNGILTKEWLLGIDTTGWSQELIEAWQQILNTYTWVQIRTDIVEGGIVDWPYQELRYEVLKAYASSLSISDVIATTYLTEYRVSKEEEQKIISKNPVSEYKWEIYDDGGNLLKTTYTYGRTLRLSFSKAGTYYVRAYQKHYVTRADVVSTQKSEYWMISETNQLLWSTELQGQQFVYNRNESEEFIETNYIQQEITASMLMDNWIFNLDPSGQLQIIEGFQVERIK